MKIKVLVTFLFALSCCVYASARGVLPLIYSTGEHIAKVANLPMDDQYTIEYNGIRYHVDLGIKHDQLSIFWVPLFNYGSEKYVMFTDEKIGEYDGICQELSRAEIEYLQDTIGGIPSEPQLPFWDAWGGKLLVLLIIVGLFFIGRLRESDEDFSEQVKESTV